MQSCGGGHREAYHDRSQPAIWKLLPDGAVRPITLLNSIRLRRMVKI
jgi:hypothetical protein